ncbi:MAG: zinc-dependent peptidase [Lacibacter sp.]
MPQDSLSYIGTNGDTAYISDTAGLKVIEVPYDKEAYSTARQKEQEYNTRTQTAVAYWFSILSLVAVGIIVLKMMLFPDDYSLRSKNTDNGETDYEGNEDNNDPSHNCLIYTGKDLRFSNNEVHTICSKYNNYYSNLNGEKKDIFISRLKKFLQTKTFYICSNKGYKEMPVLISAAAVQITFGLDEYLLSHFENIVIHPQEYIGTNPLRILEGNVQGNSINLSWKHFLEDYQNPSDGKNVGLHEMAHALQVQYLFNNNTNGFKNDFAHFDKIDDYLLKTGNHFPDSLLDTNALSNKNELWAASVELFFEKPDDLKIQYPELYRSIATALKQDTARI